ncbi:MoaD/ThiS family protein [soil metagenome]
MKIRMLYFSSLKKIAGCGAEEIEVGNGAKVSDAIEAVYTHHPAMRPQDASLLIARNQQWCDRGEALADGDEIAMMPPVSGG